MPAKAKKTAKPGPKPGIHYKTEGEYRHASIDVRLTPAEHAAVCKAADFARISRSRFCREVVLKSLGLLT